jgi:hypothetical protein
MANKIVKTFEEFISFEIENSEVHIHVEPKETEEMEAEVNESEIIQRYDRTKFELALSNMVRKHDATLGITWDTIDYYLDEYCLIK